MAEGNTIAIKGEGTIYVAPDMMRVNISLKDEEKEYEDIVRKSSENTESVQEALKKCGFNLNEIKTSDFDIEVKTEDYEDKYGNLKEKTVGYEYCHRLSVEFPRDNDRATKIMTELSKLDASPEFSIEFFVKNENENTVIEKVLTAAVNDARTKANILAKAAGVNLAQIIRIISPKADDCYASGLFGGGPMPKGKKKRRIPQLNLEPDDVEINGSVKVIWRIE
jgi:hypothetical protein